MHLKTDTGSNNHFATVPTISRSRNAFSVAQKHVTTVQFDYLYPLYWKYMYPGDTISINMAMLARLQTQVAPLYDDLYFDLHAWYVPNRLVQTNWARYQFNAQPLGPSQDNSALTSPSINVVTLGAGGFASKTLYDYFGFPTKIDYTANAEWINNYAARSYNRIWNDNYRDENLQNPVQVDLDEGPDNPANYVLLKRGRRHDVFGSSLVAAQKGTPVTLPLGTTAPISGVGKVAGILGLTTGNINIQTGAYVDSLGATYSAGAGAGQGVISTAAGTFGVKMSGTGGVSPATTNYPTVTVDGTQFTANLAAATAATLNQVRQSYAVQHLLEADSRGGTRDVESIQHRWGVTVPDFRLQRPEYLGGQTFTFDGHLVPQTSATSGSNFQAGLTSFSQAMSSFPVTHSFVEHGTFMILLSLRSNLTYQQGLMKELSYKTRYDWYQPEFANLGEVAVKNKEIYSIGGSGVQDNQTFGFQEYAYELRYGMNHVSSEMRSNYATPLDSRHMADNYVTLPTLGSAWIQSNTPISRNIAVAASTADPVQINSLTRGTLARTLPMFSIPGLKRL